MTVQFLSVYLPARPVPYAIKAKVDLELDHLEKERIMTKVDSAKWSSPIVIVKKKSGGVRFCAELKVSINPYIDAQQHPIPNPTDLLAACRGRGMVFSKLDLRQALLNCVFLLRARSFVLLLHNRGFYAYQNAIWCVECSCYLASRN